MATKKRGRSAPVKARRKTKATAKRSRSVRAASSTTVEAPVTGSKSGYRLDNDAVEQALSSGEYQGLLIDYFGETEYEELTTLARSAQARSTRGGERVLVLPGIMGSKLGHKRALFDDVLWIDPIDIVRGELSSLKLPDAGRVQPLGVILLAYLKLQLRLRIAGFDAGFHAFDWRKDIAEQGKLLARRILDEPATTVHLVAHSMGGLVARAALNDKGAAPKVGRLVMLGTPNFGSFVPIQALRGTYSIVAVVAKLERAPSPLDLAKRVFRTFPGLHQMLPSPRHFNDVDLFEDAAFWRGTGGNPELTKGVPAFQDSLSPARPDLTYLIAGVNQPTTVGLRQDETGLVYETSRAGDGTVPVALAQLPGAVTYYIEESHGSLPNNFAAQSAVIDLLQTGETKRLSTFWDRDRASVQRITEQQLRQLASTDVRPVEEMGAVDRRNVISSLVAPTASRVTGSQGPAQAVTESIGAGYGHEFRSVVVSRRRQHSIEIELAQGNIIAAKSRALVLGFFVGVDPAGPAGVVDEALDGAILEMVERRMFSADAGQVFVLPAGRSSLYADSVLFAGLGSVESFKPSVQEFVAENVVRTFVRSHVEEFATVLMGVSAGMTAEASLQHQLRGYIRGLLEVDDDHRLRRITLCERDPERYVALKEELHRLTSTALFEDVRVTLTERRLPEPLVTEAPTRAHLASKDQRIYLITTYEERAAVQVDPSTGLPNASLDPDPLRLLRTALLTAGGKATVFRDTQEFRQSQLDALLTRVTPQAVNSANVKLVGNQLGPLVLGERIMKALATAVADHQLVIVHDAAAGRIPWETLLLDGHAPAIEQGLSRRYAADNLSITKWLEQGRHREVLEVLLVVNPTGDLEGADREGARLEQALATNDGIRVTRIVHEAATRERLLREFTSGKYDALHYAGHAFFDSFQPSRSGILCANNQVLTGAHLAGLTHLPALVFFNACESGRVRGKSTKRTSTEAAGERLKHSVGLAEAFLRGGIANYIGTYWPVGDASAEQFATTLYSDLLHGLSIGDALRHARRALWESGSHDWADYIHYGSYDFVLKHSAGERSRSA